MIVFSPKEDSDVSDHEEEFYYQEVEVTVDTVTQTFADMYTSSPPQLSFLDGATSTSRAIPDHDYGKKVIWVIKRWKLPYILLRGPNLIMTKERLLNS